MKADPFSETKDGPRLFEVQTLEKIPTRVILTAKGTAGHGSLPRSDNPVLHLTRRGAQTRRCRAAGVAEYDHAPVSSRNRECCRSMPGSTPMRRRLDDPADRRSPQRPDSRAGSRVGRDAAYHGRADRDATPGDKINSIPNVAHGADRRAPDAQRDAAKKCSTRFRQIVNDPEVEIALAPGQQMPSTEPSATTSRRCITPCRTAIAAMYPRDVVLPYMSRGATDGSFLRARGMAVYGVPIFLREGGEAARMAMTSESRRRIWKTASNCCGRWCSEAAGSGT